MYLQYDKDGRTVNPKDLQNKKLWCALGEKVEEVFVSKYGGTLDVSINPEKKSNPYAPDLLTAAGHLADLKTQNTPFFKAKELYGLDPSYAVVFNRKDLERYSRYYPEIEVFFWVEWHAVKFIMGDLQQTVEYVNGVWSIPFGSLVKVIEGSQEHTYRQRRADKKGNARSSFVLDLKHGSFIRRI